MSIPFVQTDFSGGINLFDEDSSLGENEYRLGFNIRNRNGDLSLIKASEILENAPSGLKQGLYGFDQYLVLFCAGLAYYSLDDGETWTQIATFAMDATAPRLYAQAVPASTLNLDRRLQSATIVNGSGSDTRVDTLNVNISGTVAGLIVQDGVTQPWVILPDGTAQLTQTYAQWTMGGTRSYVPIGLNMAFINGILFLISPDRKSLYRSVSGRPADFVVNVTAGGDKGGDATTTAYSPTYSEMTSITALKNGQLLIGTNDGCFPLTLNYDRTIFQEPTFLNPTVYQVGIANQYAIIETLEDYYFIDLDGIRSLNSLLAEENEGRNTDFTRKISSLFDGVRQTADECAAFKFDNFSFFGVKTIYGNVALVYDTKKSAWTSVDFLTIGAIKQFATVGESTDPILFCIDDTNVYKLYSGTEYAQGVVSTRAVKSGDAKTELKLSSVRPIFDRSDANSDLRVTEYVNGRRGKGVTILLEESLGGVEYPVEYPVAFDSANFLDNLNIPFDKISNQGYKIGCSLTWKNGARLIHLQFECDTVTAPTALKQRSKVRNT